MNLVDSFYHRFLSFADYTMLVGLKLGKHVFDYPGVDLVFGGGSPYFRSVLDDIHESRIERRRRHDDKVGG